MRVLHLINELNASCGMSSSTINMIDGVKDLEVSCYVFSGSGTLLHEFEKTHPKTLLWEQTNPKFSFNPFANLQLLWLLGKLIRKHKIQVVHSHHRHLGLLSFLLSLVLKFKIIHSDHNALFGKKKISYLGGTVVTDSYNNRNHLKTYFKLPDSRIEVIPAFIDFSRIPSRKIKLVSKPKRFLAIGRLEDQKDHITLIKAFQKCLHMNNTLELVIQGNGSLESELKKYIKTQHLENNVFIKIDSNDIVLSFENADCYILSSKYEGTSILTVEAAKYGIPIIATKVGGVTEYLTETNSILIEPENAKLLSKAILNFVEIPTSIKEKMTQSARVKVDELFNLKLQSLKLFNVYKKILLK